MVSVPKRTTRPIKGQPKFGMEGFLEVQFFEYEDLNHCLFSGGKLEMAVGSMENIIFHSMRGHALQPSHVHF